MTAFSSLYGSYLDYELGTDDSTVLFTTARRKQGVNRGVQEFAKLTECLARTSTLTLTGGTGEYDLNSTLVLTDGDFAHFDTKQVEFHYTDASSHVTILAGDDLPRRDVEWLNRYTPSWPLSTVASGVQQMPSYWYDRVESGHRYLGFTPVPSTGSSASMTAVVPYIAQPAVLTSDASEPFTVGAQVRADLRMYHQAIVHYAAHQLEKLRRDDQASDRQWQKFMIYVQTYLQEKRKKGPKVVSFIANYFRSRPVTRGRDPRT